MLKGLNEELALPLLLDRKIINPYSRFDPKIKDKTVLITGAGGSIGSEITKQVLESDPKQVILLDYSEFNLYQVYLTIQESNLDDRCVPLVGDIRHEYIMESIFEKYKPDVVLHAAALKHVPLMEIGHNMLEAIRTNAMATDDLIRFAIQYDCKDFVLISTDKAVNPTSVMGATKRVAELLMINAVQQHTPDTNFNFVRFGNVLGSSGSVVPLFRRQIAQGGPVTVTHEDMTRYFMTISQAVSLVLKSLDEQLETKQSEVGQFVFRMGDPVKILDLAKQLIHLSGLELGKDIEIEITGLRPGEKLYEDISYPYEEVKPTILRDVQRIKTTEFNIDMDYYQTLRSFVLSRDYESAYKFIKKLVPEYKGG